MATRHLNHMQRFCQVFHPFLRDSVRSLYSRCLLPLFVHYPECVCLCTVSRVASEKFLSPAMRDSVRSLYSCCLLTLFVHYPECVCLCTVSHVASERSCRLQCKFVVWEVLSFYSCSNRPPRHQSVREKTASL